MGIVGVLWVVLVALKILGVALLTTSWWIVILWPIVAFVILAIVGLIFGVTLLGIGSALK